MGCLGFITLAIFIFLVTTFLIGCMEYPLLGWFTLIPQHYYKIFFLST
jgi:hypothetical protein